MRVLITGAGGQVGRELVNAFEVDGHVVAGHDHASLDITDRDAVRSTIVEFHPEAIVHSAAWTAVDACEGDPDRAFAVNAMGTRFVAEAARLVGAKVHYISTDYVFDGTKTSPYVEWDETGPVNVYGATKRDGEAAIRASGVGHLILRTSWVHGLHGANFVKTMLRLAAERERLAVVADQFGAPTGADLIADVTAHAVRACRRDASLGGTYHLCAGGVATWHAVASLAIERARELRPDIAWKVRAIEETTTEAYPTPARRPANSRLETRRLRAAFDLNLPDWTDGVARLVQACGAPAPAPFGKLGPS